MLTGPIVILTLKVAVIAVTVIFLASLAALATGRRKLHGQINLVFLLLTLTAVIGLEVIVRVLKPDVFDYFDDEVRRMLRVHLCFSVPSALLLPVMYFTGRRGRRQVHIMLAIVFCILWTGTFVTGVFFLPHG